MAMEQHDSPQSLSLSGFLHLLFNGLEGYAYAPYLNRETGEFKPVFVPVPDRLERLEQYIIETSKTTEVYLAPAVFTQPRAIKENFKATNVVWSEYDGNAPAQIDPEPTLRIKSSKEGHEHFYWLLDNPITNVEALETINRGICFNTSADHSGWDANQILRPPYTHNHKRDLPVEIKEFDATVYNVGAFTQFTPPSKIESINLGHVPDVMEVIYEYPLGTEFKDIFTAHPTEGTRSTYLMRVAYLAAEAGCNNEEIFSLLFNCDERWEKYKKRADRKRRLVDIIERARIKYPIRGATTLPEEDSISVLDVLSLRNTVESVEWVLPNMLQKSGFMVVVGPPSTGKTQLALNLTFGLTTGVEVLGFKPPRPHKILFISAEMGAIDLKQFVEKIITAIPEKHHDLLASNFLVYPIGEPMYLNTEAEQKKFYMLANQLKLDGIVFDSLGSATSKSLTDEEQTKKLLDFMDRFRKETGAFVLFIHHNRKATENNKEPSGLADVYGSQYISARATTVLSLWPVLKNVLKVRELKKRLAPQNDDWFIERQSDLTFKRVDAPTVTGGNSGKPKNSNRFGI